jgi:hypothetical protein
MVGPTYADGIAVGLDFSDFFSCIWFHDNLCTTKIYHKITKYRYFDVSRFQKMMYGIA